MHNALAASRSPGVICNHKLAKCYVCKFVLNTISQNITHRTFWRPPTCPMLCIQRFCAHDVAKYYVCNAFVTPNSPNVTCDIKLAKRYVYNIVVILNLPNVTYTFPLQTQIRQNYVCNAFATQIPQTVRAQRERR